MALGKIKIALKDYETVSRTGIKGDLPTAEIDVSSALIR